MFSQEIVFEITKQHRALNVHSRHMKASHLEAVCGGGVLYHVVFVLLGAPLVTDVLCTAAMAVWLAVLTALPCSVLLGNDYTEWHRVLVRQEWLRPAERALCTFVSTVLLLTWASAFILPLDWDVWWQAWPIPCTAASFLSLPIACLLSWASLRWG